MASSFKIDHSVSTKNIASSKSLSDQIKPALIKRFHRVLESWYQQNGRHHLPWRNTDDPYRIWLSEVMLQQTQVQTVLDRYYQPFLDAFPTIESLAHAPQQNVLKGWEGLGYYSRARNFHKAANSLRENNYQLPDDLEELLALSGIGQNTAHAILAFAFHKPYPVMEANVKRILMRIFAITTPNQKQLFALAQQLLNREQPFHYNQAMMDLGSLVCTVKEPKCQICPASNMCKGKATPALFPTRVKKKSVPTRAVTVFVAQNKSGHVALEARDAKLLGGLYGFTQTPENAPIPKSAQHIGEVRHAYTHFKLHAQIYLVPARKGNNQLYSAHEIAQMPLSKFDHKILALIKTQT